MSLNLKIVPKIVCLCGSTKFKDEFLEANKRETLAGNIVLSVGFFGHADGQQPSSSQKEALDELHKRKIDMADEVYVLDVNNYIGESTHSEIEYADDLGKPIRFLSSEIYNGTMKRRHAMNRQKVIVNIRQVRKMVPQFNSMNTGRKVESCNISSFQNQILRSKQDRDILIKNGTKDQELYALALAILSASEITPCETT